MRTFRDSKGRTWELSLTIGSAKRVRDKLGINLLEPEGGDPPLLTRLATDVILFCDVLYVMVQPEAERLQVSDIDFGEALGGDALAEATNAFYEEMIDFFRLCGRMDLAKMADKQRTMLGLVVKMAEGKISEFDAESEIQKIFGKIPTNSQE